MTEKFIPPFGKFCPCREGAHFRLGNIANLFCDTYTILHIEIERLTK